MWTHTILRLAEMEALTALGASDEAAVARREGQERIRSIAASLPEPAHRESFLRSRECARTLSLVG